MYQQDKISGLGKLSLLNNELDYNSPNYLSPSMYSVDNTGDMGRVEGSVGFSSMYQVSQTFMEGAYSNNDIKSVKFDPHEELIWCISSAGHLCGYYEWNLTKIVSIEIPEMNRKRNDNYELLDLLPSYNALDRILFLLGRHEVLVYRKSGTRVHKFSISSPDETLQCMTYHPYQPSSIVLGSERRLIELDVDKGKEVSSFGLNEHGSTSLLRFTRGLICGTSDGQILTVDMRTPAKILDNFKPHADQLLDFTVNAEGYAVISCGTYLCNRQSYPDQFLKVYDLRYKKSQCPIKVEMHATFVRFMPVFNDSILVVSNSGQFQVANFGQNMLSLPMDEAYRVNEYDTIKSIDISSNSKLIAFGTEGGLLSLASNHCDDLKFNNLSNETPFPNIPHYMSLDPVSFDDPNFVFSSSEFVTEPLDNSKKISSEWPEDMCNRKYRKFNAVDMSLFSEHQSKFKTELIGRKPSNWGSVWFPYR